jgi:hypothetical protein
MPFVTAGSSVGEKPEAWQVVQVGVVHVFVPYQSSVALP